MGGVFTVVACLYIDGQLVAAVDLCKTGQAGAHIVGVDLVAGFNQIILVVQRRTRADDAHLPGQDVVDLGKFVQARLAQESAALGDVAVGILQKMGGHVMGRVTAHRAEL